MVPSIVIEPVMGEGFESYGELNGIGSLWSHPGVDRGHPGPPTLGGRLRGKGGITVRAEGGQYMWTYWVRCYLSWRGQSRRGQSRRGQSRRGQSRRGQSRRSHSPGGTDTKADETTHHLRQLEPLMHLYGTLHRGLGQVRQCGG